MLYLLMELCELIITPRHRILIFSDNNQKLYLDYL